mgnify:CR=1 FL=1
MTPQTSPLDGTGSAIGTRRRLGALGGLMLLSGAAIASAPSIDWWSIDAGGGVSTDGIITISGSIGQPDAVRLLGPAGFSISGGFWGAVSAASCPPDLNADGQVDNDDFVLFASAYNLFDCADPSMPLECPSDFDEDGFVDNADFVIFANAYYDFLCP